MQNNRKIDSPSPPLLQPAVEALAVRNGKLFNITVVLATAICLRRLFALGTGVGLILMRVQDSLVIAFKTRKY